MEGMKNLSRNFRGFHEAVAKRKFGDLLKTFLNQGSMLNLAEAFSHAKR